jgi:hypothetical protein
LGGDVGITADFEGKGELQLVVLDKLKLLVDA